MEGKLYLITGSARGLGKGFANTVLENGGLVMISDILEVLGKTTLKELQLKFGENKVGYCKCDVTSQHDFETLWIFTEKYFSKPIDVLVNNAGVTHQYGWKKCLDVDIKGVMNGCNLALRKFSLSKGGNGGRIINIASSAGILKSPTPEALPYFVAKQGVIHLTRSLGTDHFLFQEGLNVSCICPAFADTDFLDAEIRTHIKNRGLGILQISDVTSAFQKLVEEDVTGGVMIVWPNTIPFYWPDYEMTLFKATLFLGSCLKSFNQSLDGRHLTGIFVGIMAIIVYIIVKILFIIV